MIGLVESAWQTQQNVVADDQLDRSSRDRWHLRDLDRHQFRDRSRFAVQPTAPPEHRGRRQSALRCELAHCLPPRFLRHDQRTLVRFRRLQRPANRGDKCGAEPMGSTGCLPPICLLAWIGSLPSGQEATLRSRLHGPYKQKRPRIPLGSAGAAAGLKAPARRASAQNSPMRINLPVDRPIWPPNIGPPSTSRYWVNSSAESSAEVGGIGMRVVALVLELPVIVPNCTTPE